VEETAETTNLPQVTDKLPKLLCEIHMCFPELLLDMHKDQENKKHNTICVEHHYTQTNTNNVNGT